MSISRPTFSVVLDTRRKKSNRTYPLKLRVYFNGVRKYYATELEDLTPREYSKIPSLKLKNSKLKSIKIGISEYEAQAEEIYRELEVFSFAEFERQYFKGYEQPIEESRPEENSIPVQRDIFFVFKTYIDLLFQQGSVSTSTVYSCTINSLKSFRPEIQFEDITPTFLDRYEVWMLRNGRSITTVSMYLRALRAIYNQSIEEGIISKESYPFGKRRYQIPASRNVKKALTLAEIQLIYNYPSVSGSTKDKAKDFWLFSYLCNGLNMKDICRIRYRDIDGDRLIITRAKTLRTSKTNQKPIVIPLHPHAQDIIRKWGREPVSPASFVFSILPNDVSPIRERALVQYLTRLVNKYMGKIAVELGISKPVKTYTTRHSFGTVLKRSGASIEFISESLGHKDVRTTELYLDSFEDDVKKQYSEVLLNFG